MNTVKNAVQLIGNVGNSPEIKNLEGDKKVINFSLATNEVYKNEAGEKITNTDWHSIVAWGKLAETIEKYVSKGDEILIQGKLSYRTYDDKDGNKRYITEIKANEVLFLNKSVKGIEVEPSEL